MAFKKKVSRKKRTRKIKRRVYKKKQRFQKKRRIFKKRRISRRGGRRIKKDPTICDYRTEQGGSTASTDQTLGGCKYVGHGLGSTSLLYSIHIAMVKKLMQQYGVIYTSDEEYLIKNNANAPYHTLEMVMKKDRDEEGIESVNLVVTHAQNVYTVGSNLAESFVAKVQSFFDVAADAKKNLTPPVLSVLRLWRSNTAPSGSVGVLDTLCAEIDLEKAYFNIGFKSILKLQNKTLSESGSNSTEVLNVNPLKGRLYKGIVGQNYIDIMAKQTADLTQYRGWICNNSGAMTFESKLSGQSAFKVLVDKKTVAVKSYKDFVLHPSQIVQDTINYKVKISTNKLLDNIFNALGTGTVENMRLGKIHVIGVDKLLWDRTTNTSTNGVILGVQYEQSTTCFLTFKKHRSIPYVVYSTTTNTY